MGFLIEVPTSFSSIEKHASNGKWLILRETPTRRNRAGTPDFLYRHKGFVTLSLFITSMSMEVLASCKKSTSR